MIGDGGDNNKIHGMEQDSAGSGADVGRTPQAGEASRPDGSQTAGNTQNSTQQRQEQPPCGYSGYAPYGYGGNPYERGNREGRPPYGESPYGQTGNPYERQNAGYGQQPQYGPEGQYGRIRYERGPEERYGYEADPRYETRRQYFDSYAGYEPPRKKSGAGKIIGIIAAVLGCLIIGVVIGAAVALPIMGNNAQTQQTEQQGGQQLPGQKDGENETTPNEGGGAVQNRVTGAMPEANVPETKPSLDGSAPVITNTVNPVPEIADQLTDGVVSVIAGNYETDDETGEEYFSPSSRGTGFIVSSDGYLMTNFHVIRGSEAYTVATADGEEYEATYIGADKSLDVAVLKIEAKGLKALKTGSSTELRVGEIVVAIGNPSGTGANLTGTVTVGYVSATDRSLMFNNSRHNFIQTDAAVNAGNSGGPLVNSRGEVVGIVTLKSLISAVESDGTTMDSEGLGFAIPIDEALKSVETILTTGNVVRPGIGLTFSYYSKEDVEGTDYPAGAFIYTIIDGSASDEAGLMQGDVITKCDGKDVTDNDSLTAYVKSKKVGEDIVFTVYREGETKDITVTVGDINQMG